MKILLIIIFFLSVQGTQTDVYATTPHAHYTLQYEKGFWWYEEPEEEIKLEEITEQQELPLTIVNFPPEKLWDMETPKLRDLKVRFLEQAVHRPTVENVKAYYVVQEVVRKKALAFANVASYVWQRYPKLVSAAAANPITAPGRIAKTRKETREIERVISNAAADFAMIYFYSPTCKFCQSQTSILRFFTYRHNWQIRMVNIDKQPLMAARFNVEIIPMLLLIHKYSDNYFPVTVGVASVSEIEKRLFRGIRHLTGKATPEVWSLFEFQEGGGFDARQW